VVAEDAGAQGNSVPGIDGPVSPHLQRQLVIVGGVTHAGVFHRIVDLAHGGVDGVHGDQTNDGLGGLVPVGGDIAAAVGQGQLHGQSGVGAQGGNMQIRIQDLHIGVRLDIAGRHNALAGGLDMDGLGLLAVELGNDALDIEDDLGHVLLHTRNGGKLMLDTGDLDGGHRGAGQRGQQDSAQGVAQGGAVAALQGLHHILAVGAVARNFLTFDAGLLDFYHNAMIPSFSRRRARPSDSAHQYLRVVLSLTARGRSRARRTRVLKTPRGLRPDQNRPGRRPADPVSYLEYSSTMRCSSTGKSMSSRAGRATTLPWRVFFA
jgi:hypothetical protein